MRLQYLQPVEAVMGQYIRTYKRRTNINTIINSFRKPRPAFRPSAIITRGKRYPDVSFYQGMIDWDQMREQTDAVIIRAGQNEWVDQQFFRNWAEAKRRGMKRGCYWFYDGRKSPGFQADLLTGLIRNDPPEMETVVDWEHDYGGLHEGLRNVVAMMQRVEYLLPLDCMSCLYTGYYFFIDNSNPITNAGQYDYLRNVPLWLAWYTDDASQVRVPAPWDELSIWQFGTPPVGEQYGVDTVEIDMNYFNGTEAEFYQRYGGETPPPVEVGMYYGRNKTTLTNIRSGPGAAYADIGDLFLGDLIEADRRQDVSGVLWWHLTKITRNGQNVALPGPDCWCWGTNIEEVAPPSTLSVTVDVNVAVEGFLPKTFSVSGELERA